VYSREVERTIEQPDGVAEAAVVGVPDPDYGESVVAFVVAGKGASLTGARGVAHCRAHLAGYKKPRAVPFLDALPRNASGKVMKISLRKRAQLASTAERQPDRR